MPFYLVNLIGGLGNQVFSIVSMYTLSKKHNTTFFINTSQTSVKSVGDFTIPVYKDTVCQFFLKNEYYKEPTNFDCNIVPIQISQFQDINIPTTISPTNDIIAINGLPMKYSIFKEYLDDITKLLYAQKEIICPQTALKNPLKRRVGVMFRTFLQEKTPLYMTKLDYYFKAIQWLHNIHTLKHKKQYQYEFYIYSDAESVGTIIVKDILKDLGIQGTIHECVGKRDNQSDVEHFFQMFDLDDYILCNSTYHYWPALVSTFASDKLVTYSCQKQDGGLDDWFQHIVPDNWVQL